MCPAPGMIHSRLGSSAASYRRRPWRTGTVASRSPWMYGIRLMLDKAIAALTCDDSGEFYQSASLKPNPRHRVGPREETKVATLTLPLDGCAGMTFGHA